jgi:hypothetical protein
MARGSVAVAAGKCQQNRTSSPLEVKPCLAVDAPSLEALIAAAYQDIAARLRAA